MTITSTVPDAPPRHGADRRLLVLGVQILGVALLTAALVLFTKRAVIIDLIGLVGSVALLIAGWRRTGTLFNGLSLFLPLYAMNFFVHGVYISAVPYAEGRYPIDMARFHSEASLIALVGLVALAIGYLAAPLPRRPPRSAPTDKGLERRVVAVALVVGWASRAYLLANGWNAAYQAKLFASDVSSQVNLVAFLVFLPSYALLLETVRRRDRRADPGTDRRSGSVFAIAAVVVGEIVWALLTGAKATFVPLLVAAAFAIPAVRGLRRKRSAAIAVCTAIAVLALFPIVNAVRSSASSSPGDRSIMGLFNGRSEVRTVYEQDQQRGSGTLSQLIERTSGLQSLATLVRGLRENGEEPIGTLSFSIAVKQLIPTVLYPGKQSAVQVLADRTSTLAGYGPGYHSGLAITLPGELYWSFGWPSLVIGMATVGLLLRYFDRLRTAARGLAAGRLLLIAVLIVIAPEIWIGMLLTQGIKQVAVVTLLAWACRIAVMPRRMASSG